MTELTEEPEETQPNSQIIQITKFQKFFARRAEEEEAKFCHPERSGAQSKDQFRRSEKGRLN